MSLISKKKIEFTKFYKKLNILSLILVILSLLFLLFKGLNLGVDFKGGTLIEVRTNSPLIEISEIRQSLIKMNELEEQKMNLEELFHEIVL